MKTLIIHPKDQSTAFLETIYSTIPEADKTVITSGISLAEVNELIRTHEEVIFCGHGSMLGLFSVGQFNGVSEYDYIINQETADLLNNKKKIIAIWCYAAMYIQDFLLNPAFCTDMFISEMGESNAFGFKDITEIQIEESNACFANELSTLIHKTPSEIYQQFQIGAYFQLTKTNPIAAYNFKRLFCSKEEFIN